MSRKELKRIAVIGANVGIASGTIGASLGPDAIRLAGLNRTLGQLGLELVDFGNQGSLEKPWPEPAFPQGTPRYLEEVFLFLEILKGRVARAFEEDLFPLVLGGDHCIAMASLAATVAHYQKKGIRPGLIWFDAHADLNVASTSPSGNIHGMPLAVSLGEGHEKLLSLFENGFFDPARTALIGVRSIDELEREVLEELGVKAFTMKDIDLHGMAYCTGEALKIASPHQEPFHLSFDIDGIDARDVPGTGTPVLGGVSFREAHLFLELLAESGCLGSMDLVEVNPLLDQGNRTAEVAVSMLTSAFGKTIC